MHSDDAVRRALKALADADAARHASPHVESALLDAFDRQRAHASSLRFGWHAVVAAIVVVPLAIAVYRSAVDGVEVIPTHPLTPQTMTLRNERPPSDWDNKVDARTATEGVPSSVRGSRPGSGQVVTTNHGSEMIGQTVQLRLPRSALPLFGIPVIEPDAEGTINVELLLSEDGQARTIRIVP